MIGVSARIPVTMLRYYIYFFALLNADPITQILYDIFSGSNIILLFIIRIITETRGKLIQRIIMIL